MRILIVEDEPRTAAGLKEGLEAAGYTLDVSIRETRRSNGSAPNPTMRWSWISCSPAVME